MASVSTRPLLGFTRYTKPTGETKPSGFILQDSAGNDWYFWTDTSGNLRTDEAATVEAPGFDFDSGGTVVGAQS